MVSAESETKSSERFIAGRVKRPWLFCTSQDLTTPSAPENVGVLVPGAKFYEE